MPDTEPTPRRLLAAALELVKENGIQAVTHRTVEERAGVARGSTRYHFGSRDALLEALVGYVAEVDLATIARSMGDLSEGGLAALTPEEQNAAMSRIVTGMLADPQQCLARFELYLYAARRPPLADAVAQWREAFVGLGSPHLTAAGAPQGDAAARLISASIDGLLLHALSSPHPDYATWGQEWTGLLGVAATMLGADTTDESSADEPGRHPGPDPTP